MHYYKRNIGDYSKKCGRLSMLEHGAYTLLIDACYDREQFPTREQAIEWSWARTKEEIDAVDFVLSRFFDLVDGVYVQKRIQEELETYQSNSETNRRIATEREKKRKERERSVNESHKNTHGAPPNQEPLTINHKPLTKNTSAISPPDGVSESVWQDFQKLRKAKKAAITETAINGIKREADKARMTLEEALSTCCERGWVWFKAEWVNKEINQSKNKVEESYQERASRVAAERMAEFAPGVARKISRFDAETVVGNVIAIESD